MKTILHLFSALALASASLVTAQSSSPTTRLPPGHAEAGTEVFQHNCVMCHSIEPDTKIVGPSLYHVMKGPHAASPRSVRELLANGKGTMPSFRDKLTDQQVADLLLYLKSL